MGSDTESVQLAAVGPEGLCIVFDSRIYRTSAIKKAAHKFTRDFHVLIEPLVEGQIKVVLRPKLPVADPDRSAGEFCNEVLDQELREVVAAETEGIRGLLMAQAFSKTTLIEPEFDELDYREDPQDIGRSIAPDVAAPEA